MAKQKKNKHSKKEAHNHKQPNKEKKNLAQRKKVVRVLLTIAILLAITLLILFLIEKRIIKEPTEEKLIQLQDECSLVLGNLMHSINSEGECRLRCINTCGISNLEFEKSEFTPNENDCNACNCYCN